MWKAFFNVYKESRSWYKKLFSILNFLLVINNIRCPWWSSWCECDVLVMYINGIMAICSHQVGAPDHTLFLNDSTRECLGADYYDIDGQEFHLIPNLLVASNIIQTIWEHKVLIILALHFSWNCVLCYCCHYIKPGHIWSLCTFIEAHLFYHGLSSQYCFNSMLLPFSQPVNLWILGHIFIS